MIYYWLVKTWAKSSKKKGTTAKEMKSVKKYLNRYFIDAMSAMALGLFASLLIGTIFGTLGKYIPVDWLAEIFNTIATYAKAATGMAIGVAIAYKLGAHPLVMFSAAAVGAMSNALGAIIYDGAITSWAVSVGDGVGTFYSAGPAGAFCAVIIASEIGMLVSKKTPVDILLTPLVTIVIGGLIAKYCCSPINDFMLYLGSLINDATKLNPFLMGLTISVLVGCCLTLPISSAALCVMLGIDGLAAGAATAGCCAQMIGFAVISYKDNGIGGLISQGLGTSMLQIGNIVRKPVIWLAPTLTAAILGPISTMVLKMTNSALGAGMGTAGLVGPLAAYASMSGTGIPSDRLIIEIIIMYFIAPGVISLIIHQIMKRFGLIKNGDMSLMG